MTGLRRAACAALAILMGFHDAALAAQGCGGEAGWASREITGVVQAGRQFLHEAGRHTFVLDPAAHGWRIGMLDPDGRAVPVFAPPLHPVETNPVNIAGWHFRNRDNTGPNTGDVNAPQHRRRFTYGTLAANPTGNPTANPEPIAPSTTGEGFGGLGELVITDMTLTPPEPGQRAGMTSMAFQVCLIWQGGGDRLDPIVSADPGIAFETVVSTMIGCGLDTGSYRLSDRMSKGREGGQRPYQEPDLDGDGIPDLVVPVTRLSDRAPGLAICLLGNETLVLAGYDGRIGRHLDPAYFGRADWWDLQSGPVHRTENEGPPPVLHGDGLVFGKEGASSVLLYLDKDGTVGSYWQGD